MGNPNENKIKTEQEDSDKGDEITDVLLIKEEIPSNLSKEDETDVVYELVENKTTVTKENSDPQESYDEQIEKLQQSQASIALDLEDAFAASDELARQLRKEKQTKRSSVASYLALTIAGIGLIIAAAVAFFSSNLQRDITELTATIERLKIHKHQEDETKYLHARLDDLAIKIDDILVEKVVLSSQNKPNQLDTKPTSLIVGDKVVAQPKNNLPKTLKETKTDKKVVQEKGNKQKDEKLNKPTIPPVLEPKVLKKNLPKTLKETQTDKKVVQEKGNEQKDEKLNKPAIAPALAPKVLKKKPLVVKANVKKEWAVALGSYKNASTATKNARKYQQQGVPTTVIKVNALGQVWHRLLTKAFVSQQEAARYANKVKHRLKIESVLVTKR